MIIRETTEGAATASRHRLPFTLPAPELLAALALAAPLSTAAAQSLTQLGFLGAGGPSIANGVSADGRVAVGFSMTPEGYRAFRWTAVGGLENLGAFPNPGGYTSSEAHAANADGSVVVGTSMRPDSLNENGSPFRWTAATGLQFLGTMGGSEGGWGYACTPDGSVVAGSACTSNFSYAGFRWSSPGPPVALAGVANQNWAGANCISPDGRMMAGWVTAGNSGSDAAFWSAGGAVVTVLPSLAPSVFGSSVLAMTPAGELLVGGSALHAVTWRNGAIHDLGGIPGGLPLSVYLAMGVSADGNTIVGLGNYDANSSAGSAFIWDPVSGMRDLNLVADAAGVDRHGFWMYYARGVSADGKVIVGYGFSQTDQEAFLLDLHTPPAPCYPNCDGSTAPPVLNVLDFNCFLNRFTTGDAYANCDGSTTPPVLNVLDFNCFMNRFAAGCP